MPAYRNMIYRVIGRVAFAAIWLLIVQLSSDVGMGTEVQQRPQPQRPQTQPRQPQRPPGPGGANQGGATRNGPGRKPERSQLGVPEINDERAFAGYTLINPMKHTKAYLVDMDGKVVNIWHSEYEPALSAYLLENGHLLRPAAAGGEELPFRGSGDGGRLQEFTWEGELVWDFKYVNANQFPHHDITPLPNGNVLMIIWDRKTKEEAIARGRRPAITSDHCNSDSIIEVKPTGKTTGEIVWQWNAWDHLIQDADKVKPGYGRVTAHPELIDVNFGTDTIAQMMTSKEDLEKLRSLGYVGGGGGSRRGDGITNSRDLTHFNSVAYNADTDQILLSSRLFNEVWIIDHGTTTAEAAGHTAGKRGHGGDLLYRWGNPRAYRSGTNADQRLFSQHNANWIGKGRPGEGNLLIFNNGEGRPDGEYSTVDEIVLPIDEKGMYLRETGLAFGPKTPVWSYSAENKTDFFSLLLSSAQRLLNGNTLICRGNVGILFEVTSSGETVWQYTNPVRQSRLSAGLGQLEHMPALGEVLPEFLEDELRMTLDQRKALDEFEAECAATIGEILTEEQKQKVRELESSELHPIYRPGVIMSRALQNRLQFTPDQQSQLSVLQRRADDLLGNILQKGQMKKLQVAKNSGWGGPDELESRGKRAPPERDGQRPGQPPRRPGGQGPEGDNGGPKDNRSAAKGPGDGAPGQGGQRPATTMGKGPPCALFHSQRYAADYPGLAGRDLTSGKPFARAYAESETKPANPRDSSSE